MVVCTPHARSLSVELGVPKERIGDGEFSPSWEFPRGDSNSGSLKTNTFPATVSGSSLIPCRESPLPAQGISCGCRGRARGRGAAPRQQFPRVPAEPNGLGGTGHPSLRPLPGLRGGGGGPSADAADQRQVPGRPFPSRGSPAGTGAARGRAAALGPGGGCGAGVLGGGGRGSAARRLFTGEGRAGAGLAAEPNGGGPSCAAGLAAAPRPRRRGCCAGARGGRRRWAPCCWARCCWRPPGAPRVSAGPLASPRPGSALLWGTKAGLAGGGWGWMVGAGCWGAARAARHARTARPRLSAECLRGNGASYRGNRRVASGGAPCLNWLAVRSDPGAAFPAGGSGKSGREPGEPAVGIVGGGSGVLGTAVPGADGPAALQQSPRTTTAAETRTATPRPGATSEAQPGSPSGAPATSLGAQVGAAPAAPPPSPPALPGALPSPACLLPLGAGFVTQGGVSPAHKQPRAMAAPAALPQERSVPGAALQLSPVCAHICLPAVPCSAPRAFPLVPAKARAKPCPPLPFH